MMIILTVAKHDESTLDILYSIASKPEIIIGVTPVASYFLPYLGRILSA